MTASLFLSRARLRDDISATSVVELLGSSGPGHALAGHRLVWTLFADDPERERDFLWREDERGRFYILSTRPPEDRRGLFELDPPRAFSPALRAGDRLRFALRVNATVARRTDDENKRGKPRDIVMDALFRSGAAADTRAAVRARLLHGVAHAWLASRGRRHGFSLVSPSLDAATHHEDWEEGGTEPFRVLGYRAVRIPRSGGAQPMRIGVLDLEGELVVDDGDALIAGIARGFGRAKAFGCGLMLIRRRP